MKRLLHRILLCLFISLLTFSASQGEGFGYDLKLSIELGSSFDRLNYFNEKLADFESGSGSSIDPFYSFTGGVTPSLQFKVKFKNFVFEGLVQTGKNYEAFIREEDGGQRYHSIIRESPPFDLVKTNQPIKLMLSSSELYLFMGRHFRPSLSVGIVIRRSNYRFQVKVLENNNGLFFQDSNNLASIGSYKNLPLIGMRMNYGQQFKPFKLTSSVAFYPLARFEVSPPQLKQAIYGGGADLLLGAQWNMLTASYRFEYLRSNGGIVKWRNNSFQLGLVFTII